jgi:hypothetical protein
MNDISKIKDADWGLGQQRAEIIRELATQRRCSNTSVFEAAETLQVSTRYIYRLIRDFRTSAGLLTGFVGSISKFDFINSFIIHFSLFFLIFN